MTDNTIQPESTEPDTSEPTPDPGTKDPTGVEGANPALDDTGNFKAAEVGRVPRAAGERGGPGPHAGGPGR